MRRARALARVSLAASLLAAAAVAAPASARAAPPAPVARRVVLVVFGGGVRTTELLGRPDLLPTVAAIAKAGFSSPGWAVAGADHEDAVEGILTGRRVPVVSPGRVRPAWPTLLECARAAGFGAKDAWYASYAGGEALSLATSDHAEYGDAFAPSIAFGAGPFGEPLEGLFRIFGRPDPTTPRTWAWLERLRGTTAKEAAGRMARGDVEAKEALRLEKALLEEVDRRAADLGGAGALDARAMRAAITVLRLWRPRLLVVRLGQADVGHQSLAAYWDVLKRADAELARLRAEIASDPALATSTSLVLVPEMGRNGAPNAIGGLDHDEGSADVTRVAVVGEGPAWRKGASPKAPLDVRDLAPTIGRWLGFGTPHAEGVARDDLLAPGR
jgi:hypothetical protein